MLKCFRCKLEINEPQKLFEHIKKVHRICGKNCEVQCTLCGLCFTNFSSFKLHVVACFAKTPIGQTIPLEMYEFSVDADVCKFEGELKEAALELVCDLGSNARTPRCEVFNTIAKVKQIYLSKIIAGIKDVISPHLPPVKEEIMDQFLTVLESSFSVIDTEDKLHGVLLDLDLIAPLTKCEVMKIEDKNEDKPQRKRRKPVEESNNTYIVDGIKRRKRNIAIQDSDDSGGSDCDEGDYGEGGDYGEDDENIEETDGAKDDKAEEKITKGTVVLMPIEFQIKKFLELPNVFEKMKLNSARILEQKDKQHFIQCELWKEKLKNYKPDQIVIPFHFYGDGVQLNNPLGPHSKSGEQQMCYFSFPLIPSEYQSTLNNIFVAQLYPAKFHQMFSTEELYNNLIAIFQKFAEEGIQIKVDGEEITVFLVCGLFIGDNKEQNQRLGYVGSFSGLHCCRYCDMHLDQIRISANSRGATLRNRDNYDANVVLNDVTTTGVKEYSIFNSIPFFHVTESSAADITHDLTEGVLHKSLSHSILHFINEKYFDLNYLNNQISEIDFGEAERGNRPTTITMAHLKAAKFKMTASEVFFFMHHLTLIIGDRVPNTDPVWQHVLVTLNFFDICYLPSITDEQIDSIVDVNEVVNRGLMDLFGVNLQHKSHLGTHYTVLTKRFGPLRQFQTIRFEAKHKEIKSYAKNTNSRINLSLSIGLKLQYKFALRLLRQEGLEDRILIPNYTKGTIDKKVYYKRLPPSIRLTELSQGQHFFTKKAEVNGIIFSLELWLPNFEDDKNKKINQIIDIVTLELNQVTKIFAICKTYATIAFDDHHGCHVVDMNSLEKEISIISVREFLNKHYYPVKIHNIQDKYLFRCKRF